VTVSCGVVEAGTVVPGGDSALSADGGDQTIGQPKVFELAGMLFGCAGEMRVVQLLKHVFEIPLRGEGQDPEQYVVRDFARELRAFLSVEAPELVGSSGSDDEPWSLLLAVGGKLSRICSHFTVRESQTGYDAIGSGTPFALGSLASTVGQPPRVRVETALKAAELHVPSVKGPFCILTSGGMGGELPGP
jgi:hypothetical protein